MLARELQRRAEPLYDAGWVVDGDVIRDRGNWEYPPSVAIDLCREGAAFELEYYADGAVCLYGGMERASDGRWRDALELPDDDPDLSPCVNLDSDLTMADIVRSYRELGLLP